MAFDIKKALKLEGLNIKEFYAWPVTVHMLAGCVAFLVVAGIGTGALLMPTHSKLEAEIAKEAKLKESFVDKKKMAANLDLYLEQLEQVRNDSENLLKQLPNKSEIESLLVDINQSGLSRGLVFELFKPEKEKILDFYSEQPISIKVKGNYKALGEFASDVSQLSRVVILTDMNLTNKDGLILMEVTAKTFRYLDQEEVDAKRRAAELAKKNTKGKRNSKPATKK